MNHLADNIASFRSLLIEPPSWQPTPIGGVLLGLILPFVGAFFVRIIVFLWHLTFSKDVITGNWYAYHWTYVKHKPQAVQSLVQIKKGIKNRWRFILKQNIYSAIAYKGTINPENQHLICACRSVTFPETTYIRLSHPLGTKCETMVGVWMSYDHDKNPASGAILLTRNEITIQDAVDSLNISFGKGKGAHSAPPLIRLIRG